MDNQQKLQNRAQRLEKDLQATFAVEKAVNNDFHRTLCEWLTTTISIAVDELTSSKFDKDHTGYLKCKAGLDRDRFLLRKIQAASDPKVKDKLQAALSDVKEALDEPEPEQE